MAWFPKHAAAAASTVSSAVASLLAAAPPPPPPTSRRWATPERDANETQGLRAGSGERAGDTAREGGRTELQGEEPSGQKMSAAEKKYREGGRAVAI